MTTQNNGRNYNNDNEVFTPTVRSSYKFFNSESLIDNTAMSFNYWNTLLKISMNPIIVKEGSANKVDTDNHVDIYLSPSKAQMLLHCVQEFRANPNKYTNLGVSTNKGLILIANGEKMFGHGGTCIVIKIIDNETGEVQSDAAYEFNTSDFFGISNYNGGNDFEKYYGYADNIELDMFENLLAQFINAYTNAVASSIMEANKFNEARQFSFINDVREKLGIQKNSGGESSRNYNRSSWFNNNGGSSVSSESHKNNNSSSYDEVMNDIASIMD